MRARRNAIFWIAVLGALLVLYFALMGYRAVALLASNDLVAILIGIALIILPLIGVWALWREIIFGRDAIRLSDELERRGLMPEEEVAVRPSGRPVREDADAAFPKYRAAAEADPASWEALMRLGIVYDACGDRTRARAVIREAISLEKLNNS